MSNKCIHDWKEVKEGLHWCKRCGSIKDWTHSFMSDKITSKIKLPEMYKNYLRGILSYGK